MNPDYIPLDSGKEATFNEISNIISHIVTTTKVDGVTISGGEPFLQAKELASVVAFLNHLKLDDILIYTGYTKEELVLQKDPSIDYILDNIAVLIDGPYVDSLNDNLPLRGSSNQRIHYIRPAYKHLYEQYMEQVPRGLQSVMVGEYLWHVGIPRTDAIEKMRELVALQTKED
jgi:anaerobic ribonucleoside-triphosphate reductase activating protein